MTAAQRLREVSDELSKGRIYEATIIDMTHHVEGLCDHDTAQITINPQVSVIDTLIHELLHRRYPSWTERRVRQETRRLIGNLTNQELGVWYRRYRRMVKKRGPVIT